MRIQRAKGVTFERSGDRVVLLDPEGATVLTLNPVGSIVWETLDEPRDISTVVEMVADVFGDVPVTQLEEDVRAFVGELMAEDVATEC